MYVLLALHIPGGGTTPEMMDLCAVTDKLVEGVDALLTPDTLEQLKETQSESRELAVRIVRAERNATEEIDHEDEMSVQKTLVHQPDSTVSRAASTAEGQVTAKEAGDDMFAKEQR
ncbi:hypothetical protein MTO96_036786 [Rhipicephalus appendiculatus]